MRGPRQMKLKFAIRTLGCKVNQYESEVLKENLERLGHSESSEKEADVIVINSCTVTRDADTGTRYLVRRSLKDNPSAKIFVTGCYVVSEDDISVLRSMPGIYKLVRNEDKNKIPLMLGDLTGQEPAAALCEGVTSFSSHTRAFLKIQDGCGRGCSYCKVTLVRGASRSRDRAAIIAEAERLVRSGKKEIVLTGICLSAWEGASGDRLSGLICDLGKIKGDFRLRLSSVEPDHVDDDLIAAVEGSSRLCRHFHIPLQSGSDTILALMKRKYDTDAFRGTVSKIRRRMPLAGISVDMIVGFPGETDDDFENTIHFINDIKPSRIHAFIYSDRKGTASYEMGNKVPIGVARKRLSEIMKAGERLQHDFASAFVGREIKVLIEQKEHGEIFSGYSGEYVRVKVAGALRSRGDLVRCIGVDIFKDGTILRAREE